MQPVDWLILTLPAIAVVYIAFRTHSYTKGVAGFLAGGRVAGRYVVAVASGEAAMGLAAAVAVFELYYNSGFAIGFWQQMAVPIGLLMMLTGFLIFRYRETRVMTLAQFFEVRYSKRFRIFAGLVAFGSGLINYALFPAVSARFIIYYTGLPLEVSVGGWVLQTFPLVMLFFLGIALSIVLIGGQLSIMVTDCVQGIFCYAGYALVFGAILCVFTFQQFGETMLARGPGMSFVNPFDTGNLRDFNLLFIFIGLFSSVYNRLSWQGTQGYNASALNAHEQKMAGVLSSWREGFLTLMLMMLAIAVYTYMNHPDHAQQAAMVQTELVERIQTGNAASDEVLRKQMLMPVAAREFLPVGVVGVFLAVAVFLMVSTDTTNMHSWGSILAQDVILPLRKKPFSTTRHLLLLRLSITGVAAFAFGFSLLYGQITYILMFMALTGAFFLGGAGSVIIGGLYWSRGTTAGAWAAMIVGLIFAILGFFFTHYWESLVYPYLHHSHPVFLESLKNSLEGLGRILPIANWEVGSVKFPISGREILFLTMFSSIISYVAVSLLTCREKFNLDRMLHRGEYARPDENPGALPVKAEKKRRLIQKILGFNEAYTRGDRILAWAVFIWTMGNFAIFAIAALWNILFGVWSNETWFLYWKYYTVGLTAVVAVVTTIWFTLGGILDLRKLFQRLKVLRVNALDDGRVIEHMNADDFAAAQKTPGSGGPIDATPKDAPPPGTTA